MQHFQNGLRQYIAIPIFIYAFQFAIERKALKYFIWITIAVLFHKSAAILYLVYFIYAIFPQPVLKNRFILYSLLTVSFIFSLFDFTSFITDRMDALLLLTNYDIYSDSDYLLSNEKKVNILMFLQYIIYMFFISHYQSVSEYFKEDKRFNYMFDLFFISTCLYFIFFRSLIIARILRYFTVFEIFIIGYYIKYAIDNSSMSYRNYAFRIILCLYLFAFYSAIIIKSNTSTVSYVSYFQSDLHSQKEEQHDAAIMIIKN